MKHLWNLTIDDYLEICERAMKKGLVAGDSMEEILLDYVEEKGIKSSGATELTEQELIKEYVSHGKKVLTIDEEGVKIYKPKEKEL